MEELSSNPFRLSSMSCVVLGSSLISLSPFFVEFSHLDAVASSFYRLGIGGITLLLIALLRKEPFLKGSLLILCFLAAFVISLDLVAWHQSVLYIGAGLSTVLANLEMFFLILIGALFFRERLPSSFIKISAAIVLGICCLVHPYFFEFHTRNALGIVFGLGASLIYSIYLLLLKMIRTKDSGISSLPMLATICLSGALILGIFIAFTPSATFSIPDWRSFGYIFSNAMLCQVLGWLFITKGIKQVSLSLSGILMLAQPALTFLIDCLFLGRNTHWLQTSGCIILLAAVYRISRKGEKEIHENEPKKSY